MAKLGTLIIELSKESKYVGGSPDPHTDKTLIAFLSLSFLSLVSTDHNASCIASLPWFPSIYTIFYLAPPASMSEPGLFSSSP
jgi:hypothetical protein